MSPHMVKKQIPVAPSPVVSDMNRKQQQQQQPVPSSYYNQHYHPPTAVNNNYTSNQKLPPNGGYHQVTPQQPNPPIPSQRGPMSGPGPAPHHPHHPSHNHNPSQHHPSSYMTTQLQQTASPNPMGGPAATPGDHHQGMCYCTDCPPPQQQHHHQDRHQIEDEIMIQKRELDSCWQEDEEDFPMVSVF